MKRILIVEDDQILAKIYRNKFQQEQFSVETAADGQCALDMLAASPPDVVLLDLMLPKVNGVEVLKTVRSRAATQAIPVVVFTNAYLDTLIQEAWNAGATQCLTEANCTPKQVVELVRELMQNTPDVPPPVAPRAAVSAFPPPPSTAPPSLFPPPASAHATLFPPPANRTTPAFPPPSANASPPSTFFPGVPMAVPFKMEPPLANVHPPHVDTPPEWLQQLGAEAVAPPAPGDFSSQDPDAQFQNDLRRTLAEQSTPTLDRLRLLYQSVIDASEPARRQAALFDFHRKLRSLANDAAIANANSLIKIAGAMESLVKVLHDKPAHFNASIQRTLDQSFVLLNQLMPRLARTEPPGLLHGSVLIVDSDTLTQRALVLAVTRTELETVALEEAGVALKKLAEGPQDLVIIDTDITDLSGAELQRQMRSLPVHRETPVILVVMQPDLPAMLSQLVSPHDDLIAKPIQFAELSLKCLVHVLRQNLQFCGWD
jgi:DNA-binding response OmpR family regulator